jgi:murein DD-endopeptidase MepM/ murein hydrolase activator NlpD
MQKILAPADRVVTEIGRFVLIRPIVSGVLLLTAILITLFSNGIFKSADDPSVVVLSQFNAPLIAGTQLRSFLTKSSTASDNNHEASIEPQLTTASTLDNHEASLFQATSPSTETVAPTVTHASNQTALPIPADATWQAFQIHKGDTLARLFKKYKINSKDIAALASLPEAKPLQHLKPAEEMLLIIDSKHNLQKLTYASGTSDELILVRTASGFQLEKNLATAAAVDAPAKATPVTAELDVPASNAEATKDTASLSYISGEVHKSLTTDARKAGLSAKQANQLAQIFNGQKIQRGDQFSVLVEDPGKGANKNTPNSILIAQLSHSDKLIQLIRFTDPKGDTSYYTPQGESMGPGILRAPLQFKRISSYFSSSRFHPILHFFRPHLGVDYAASFGTPIKAAGNGVIEEIERSGGYGKSIMIKHDAKYSTLYAHMSRFVADLKVGSVVHQGQVIGYVGSTGLATGPHLHYEIHVNNVAMNPLTVSLPSAMIPKAWQNQFFAQAKILLATLKSNHSVRLANNDEGVKRS